ncbi:hypothetical protein M3Y99_00931100 [Aphelenchoides fujianensis]|nr:hypothetical protein M3Y99_00931100 [Aphelenchoides fujianensis]
MYEFAPNSSHHKLQHSFNISSSSNKPFARLAHSDLYKNEGLNASSMHQKHRDETAEIRRQKRTVGFAKVREERENQPFDSPTNFEAEISAATDPQLRVGARVEAIFAIARSVRCGLLRTRPEVGHSLVIVAINLVCNCRFELRISAVEVIKEVLSCHDDRLTRLCAHSDELLKSLCDLLTVQHTEAVLSALICLDEIMQFAVAQGNDAEIHAKLADFDVAPRFEYLRSKHPLHVFAVVRRFCRPHGDEPAGMDADC